MGKNKKKAPSLKIKTSRYFTKTCTNCNNEYPNWFVNCPKCGTAWDGGALEQLETLGPEEIKKKNIKIVVKITEEDFDEPINRVQLIFSADHGKAWYQMKMDIKMDYFIAEIAEVPIGSVIIYYIEVYLANGEKVIENNSGNYFYYKVGEPIAVAEEQAPEPEAKTIQENIAQTATIPQDYIQEKQNPPISEQDDDDVTIFGKLQTELDPDLKICPQCNSKIKKMWSICPICGGNV